MIELSFRKKVLLFSASIGIALMASSNFPPRYTEAQTKTFSVDNRIEEVGSLEQLCAVLNSQDGEVRIELKIEPYLLQNYQNVFQTSDQNGGIRFEIDENGAAGVIVAAKNGDILVVGSDLRISGRQTDQIEIVVSSRTGVSMAINDSLFSTNPGIPDPKCDRVRVGVGFDDTRAFVGEAEFHISGGLKKDWVPFKKQAYFLGQSLLFISFLLWAIQPADKNKTETNPQRK